MSECQGIVLVNRDIMKLCSKFGVQFRVPQVKMHHHHHRNEYCTVRSLSSAHMNPRTVLVWELDRGFKSLSTQHCLSSFQLIRFH